MEFIACFALIIILIRLKVPIGLTLMATSVLLAIMEFGLNRDFFTPFEKTAADFDTWILIITIMLVVTLGDILAYGGYLERLVHALKGYISPRNVARIAPALIGLLPMPGGAMVSAPIVEELAKGSDVSAESKASVNFWWRHIWEPVWPLYQSVILAAAILGVSVWRVAYICFPITLASIAAGLIVIKSPLSNKKIKSNGTLVFIKEMTFSLWPVIFIVSTGLIFKIDLVISLIALYLLMLLLRITNFKIIYRSYRREFNFDLVLLFLGGLTLMNIIESGQAAGKTLSALSHWGIPIDLVVFALPFAVGLLTGLTAAYVGVGFPLVSSVLLLTGGLSSGILLSYAGGFMGIMVSPVHLCLILTKNYFKAGFVALYRRLIPAVLLASLLVFAIKYIFYPN